MAGPESVVPSIRIRVCNDGLARSDGAFVLYWMTANRRTSYNYALDRAMDWSLELRRPLLVLEALRLDYRWANDRLHSFILQGMADNQAAFAGSSVRYYPYAEQTPDAGKGLLMQLARQASLIVTDEFPCFFLPGMLETVAKRAPVRVEAVDSNGLLPLRAAERVYPSAYSFRRFLQRSLPEHLGEAPRAEPLRRRGLTGPARIKTETLQRWPPAPARLLRTPHDGVQALHIDHTVTPGIQAGGQIEARRVLSRFLRDRLSQYSDARNQPEQDGASGLSSYLHFGHIAAHEVFARLVRREKWQPTQLAQRAVGQREGWWGMSPEAESFVDQLVTWRELGYNMTWQRDDYDRFASLPDWARETLQRHGSDVRSHAYTLKQFETGQTHDPLWNAAQRQLVTEGVMHNYLRMLWGKKILEWSRSPKVALKTMIELNNKYALDGRNPNSYSGIFWVLGRYDRPWGPERPIFGKVRYMSSANTAKKLRVRGYIKRYAD